MLYFKGISFIVGLAFSAFGAWAFLSPQSWTDFLVGKVWVEKNPAVLVGLFLIHLTLAVTGWFLSFRIYRQPYAYLVSGFLTLGAVKLGGILSIYRPFRQAMVLLLTTETLSRVLFMVLAFLLGSGMILLGILIH